MEKLVYLLWNGSGRLDAAAAGRAARPGARRAAGRSEPVGLSMDLADAEAAAVHLPLPPPPDDPAPGRPGVGVARLPRRPWPRSRRSLAPQADRLAGYLVTESIPTDYGDNQWASTRDWPDGERSPGVVDAHADGEARSPRATTHWYAHWYGTQTPMSTAIQPRIRYVRNAVARPLTDGAPPYRGIVEEAWPSAEHVNDPMLFYCADGDDGVLAANMTTMIDSVTAFLDMDRIRLAAMSEYLLESI